jgi:hypothetical protein
MEFYAGNVSNSNQAEELHITHSLDGVPCKQYQQWQSSKEAAHNPHSE